jgi:hypothetical protein
MSKALPKGGSALCFAKVSNIRLLAVASHSIRGDDKGEAPLGGQIARIVCIPVYRWHDFPRAGRRGLVQAVG